MNYLMPRLQNRVGQRSNLISSQHGGKITANARENDLLFRLVTVERKIFLRGKKAIALPVPQPGHHSKFPRLSLKSRHSARRAECPLCSPAPPKTSDDECEDEFAIAKAAGAVLAGRASDSKVRAP